MSKRIVDELRKEIREKEIIISSLENKLEKQRESIIKLESDIILLKKPRECNIGCVYLVLGMNSCGSTMDCKKGFKCSRVFKDEFERRD